MGTGTAPARSKPRPRRQPAKARATARVATALPPATFLEPMKALGAETTPAGLWRCEIKFDGYRALAVLNAGRAELWSRNHKPMNADYPEVVAALEKLKCRDAIIDGEIVALDEQGRSRFQLLQGRALGERPPLRYYVFDLLRLDGEEIMASPIEERQARLAAWLKKPPAPLALSPWFDVEPGELLAAAREQGLEGIIAKRPGSPYEIGRRSGAWLKCKVQAEQEFVIGGFTPPQGSRGHFGAILVGCHDEGGELVYCGKVGTGFDRALLADLHARFLRLGREKCPFANLPMTRRPRFGRGMTGAEMKRVTWLRPELVAQVRFAEWTQDGLLRQPVFLGLRKDKDAREVRREPGAIRA